jgi:hypothetical protein
VTHTAMWHCTNHAHAGKYVAQTKLIE